MALFPLFIELSGRRVLIVGGGRLALHKARMLLPYGAELTAVAPEFCPELEAMEGLTLVRRAFEPRDVEGAEIVIAATDERDVNRAVSALCRERGIPVNVVDELAECSFVFPALLRRGALSAGVTTAGCSPTAAAWARDRLDEALPEGFEDVVAWLGSLRPELKARIPEQRRRSALFRRLFELAMERGWPLTRDEMEAGLEAQS